MVKSDEPHVFISNAEVLIIKLKNGIDDIEKYKKENDAWLRSCRCLIMSGYDLDKNRIILIFQRSLIRDVEYYNILENPYIKNNAADYEVINFQVNSASKQMIDIMGDREL